MQLGNFFFTFVGSPKVAAFYSLQHSHYRESCVHLKSFLISELTMAEPFGVVAGAVSISAAFTVCVDCFGYIQFGRHFGRDFQTDQLSLNCARLRLARWGQAVDIYNDPKLGKPKATATEIQTAKDTLLQILALFADSKDISKKYKLGAKTGEDLTPFSANDMDPASLGLENRMKELAIKRQKGTHTHRLTTWALYHRYKPKPSKVLNSHSEADQLKIHRRSELKRLIESITSLIDNIETLFPAPQTQITLIQQDAAEISDKETLRLIEEAAEAVDSKLKRAAQDVVSGHQYVKVGIRGTVHNGDAYSDDWKGNAIGRNHTYDGVEVEAGGKALNGNKYGGKDFWDE